jgi:SAM-dependent methyltransferase
LTPACPSCGSIHARRVGALPKVSVFARRDVGRAIPASSLYRCPDCHLLFRHPVLEARDYDALYGEVDSACWADEPGRMDWAVIEAYVARTAPAGARILDFGCHTGGLLERLGSRYARTGIEVNERAAAIARTRTGAAVVRRLEDLPAEARFDIVIAADVVEHFTDPGSVIGSLLSVLAPGGTLVVTTGDADCTLWKLTGARWWYCFFPEHLSFISKRWMLGWLQRTGSRAVLVEAGTFRHLRLSPFRYAIQSCLLLAYLAAPGWYVRAGGRLRYLLGRGERIAYAPGTGLSKDHVLIALR